jgi:hypothetical protein
MLFSTISDTSWRQLTVPGCEPLFAEESAETTASV